MSKLNDSEGAQVFQFSDRAGSVLNMKCWLKNVDRDMMHPGPFTIYASEEFFRLTQNHVPDWAEHERAFGLPTFLVEYNDFLITPEPLLWRDSDLVNFLRRLEVPHDDHWSISLARSKRGDGPGANGDSPGGT